MSTHGCTRHRPGSMNCYNHCRCRCRPCRATRARYDAERLAPTRATVPSSDARAAIATLDRAGLSRHDIADVSGVPRTTINRVARERRRDVRRATSEALVQAARELCAPPARLPFEPLGRMLQLRSFVHGGLKPMMGENDVRSFYRARDRGWWEEPQADEFACRFLGEPFELVYGTDWNQEAA